MGILILKVNVCVPLQELIAAYSEPDKKTILKKFVMPVEYVWYWENESTFEKYDKSVGKEIERAYRSGHAFQVTLGQYGYDIDPAKMKQTNLATKKERRIDRRPKRRITIKAKALDSVLEMLETHVHKIEYEVPFVNVLLEPLLKLARQNFVIAERMAGHENIILLKGMNSVAKSMEAQLDREIKQWILASEKLAYPSHWEHQDSNCMLKMVSQGTAEWIRVKQQMTEPCFPTRILRIERIQNRWLWKAYDQSRKRVSDKTNGQLYEKELFHGTRMTRPIKIYNSEQGFDNRLSSRAGLWGEGAYFAVRAKYSDGYAFTNLEGYKQMFMVKVITGITCKYQHEDRNIKAPPVIPMSSTHSNGLTFEDQRYDSVSGYTHGSEVFVIYEHGRVYPEYLITYT